MNRAEKHDTKADHHDDSSGVRGHASSAPESQALQAVGNLAMQYQLLAQRGSPLDGLDDGDPLSSGQKRQFAPALGHRVDHLRLHSGLQAQARADDFGATAFTFGRDIVLGRDARGEHLAHEIYHAGRAAGGGGGGQAATATIGDRYDREEVGAERFAALASSGHQLPEIPPRPGGDHCLRRIPRSGEVPAPRRATTFSYLPESGLDIIWPLEDASIYEVAAEIYGNEDLAHELTEVYQGGGRGLRFNPRLLAPDWRLVYFEQLAAQRRSEAMASAELDLSLTGSVMQLDAVVVYLGPGGGVVSDFALPSGEGGEGATIDLTGGASTRHQPVVLLQDIEQSGASDWSLDLPGMGGGLGVQPEQRYMPQADYGAAAGDLADIVESPRLHRDVLDQDDDAIVTVRVDPNGAYGHLASGRSWYVVPSQPLGGPLLGGSPAAPGFRLGPEGLSFDLGTPTTGAVLLQQDPINLVALDMALTLQQGSEEAEATELASGASLLIAPQNQVMVLDVSGPSGTRRQGRFIIIGGAEAQAMMMNPQAADTYTWNGSSLSSGTVSPDVLGSPLTQGGEGGSQDVQLFWQGMGQQERSTDQTQLLFDVLNGQDPLATAQLYSQPEVVYLQVFSVGELRSMVRRYAVQSMLRSARDEEGVYLQLDRRGLANRVTSEGQALGTSFDYEAIVDTGFQDVSLEETTPQVEDATLEGTLDLFDIAQLQLRPMIRRHDRIRDLLTALRDRLENHEQALMENPDLLSRYAGMINQQIQIAQSAGRALQLIPRLKARYRGLSTLTRELDEIRDLYGLALAFSDRSATAQTLYRAADMRMVMFPLLAVQTVGEETNEEIVGVLRQRGDESWLMGMSVTEQREHMRTLSETNQATDFRDFQAQLTAAREAIRSGDREAATQPTESAAEIVDRMQGRYRILAQLHQALVAFQHMGNSSAAYTQAFTGNDEKLESLVSRLQGMLDDFENAATPEAQADVMRRLGELWESDAAYQAFYRQIYTFISRSDFWVKVGIMVAAGLLTWGAGSVAVGTGFVAAEGLGLLALESAVFTGAHMAGERLLFEHDPSAGLEGFAHPEDETAGDIALQATGEFAFNMLTFGMAKKVGALGRALGGRIGMPAAGEMAAVFTMFEGIGVGQYMYNQQSLPDMQALLDITGQNAIMLGTMHVAGLASRPLFERVQFRVARGVGNYQGQMRILELRRMRIAEEMRDFARLTRETQQADTSRMGRLSAQAERLAAEAARLQVEMQMDPRIQERGARDPAYAEAMEASAARLEAHGDVMAEILFSARTGIREVGPASLFNNGMAGEVVRFYQERGYDVSQTVDEVGLSEIRASKNGDTIILRESREANVGRGFQEAYEAALADPEVAFSHPGIELHNHLNGILHATEIIELFFEGNPGEFLRLINREIAPRVEQGRTRLAELEGMSTEGLSAQRQTEIRNEIAELRDVQRIMDVVQEGLANPQQAQRAAEELLTATERVRFDRVYDIPRDIVRDSLTPEQYRVWIESSLARLVQDGVSYVELQGKVPLGRGISEAEFMQMCQRAGVEVRFLRILPTTELGYEEPVGGSDPARYQQAMDMVLEGRYGPATEAQIELATQLASTALSPRAFRSLIEGLAESTTIGFDVAGAERGQFTERGMRSFEEMYRILETASRAMGRKFVLRPHVGEGYVPSEARPGEPVPADTARANIDMLLGQLEASGYTPESGVIVRLGHVTHATPGQIARMANLGVIAEANIGSNIATGAIPPPGPGGAITGHPLLQLMYAEVPVVLSTDAGGVMRTTMETEFQIAESMIRRFRAGEDTILVNGEPMRFQDLSPREQQRFDIERLAEAARNYRQGLDMPRGQYPPTSPYLTPQYDFDDEYGVCEMPEEIPQTAPAETWTMEDLRECSME